jgi:hypothetical protein
MNKLRRKILGAFVAIPAGFATTAKAKLKPQKTVRQLLDENPLYALGYDYGPDTTWLRVTEIAWGEELHVLVICQGDVRFNPEDIHRMISFGKKNLKQRLPNGRVAEVEIEPKNPKEQKRKSEEFWNNYQAEVDKAAMARKYGA